MVDQRAAPFPALPSPRFDPGRLERAFAVLDGQVACGDLPAAVLAVAGPSGPYEVRAFGDDGDRRVGTGDRFLIASITKPIVATMVMQLVEEGAIALSEPIDRLLPEFRPTPAEPGRPAGETISAWHVLTHTSGVVDADWGEALEVDASATDLLASACTRPLAFVPGTEYRYSSDPFYLLAELVRRADGTASYAESLRRRLLDPLGMTATSFHADLPGVHAVPPRVAGFDAAATARWAAFFDSIEAPGGGLWSTAGDLVRFGRATLLGGTLEGVRVLGRPFVELMAREQTVGIFEAGDPPRRPGYGLGWGISWVEGRMPGSPGQVDHMGATGSRLWVDPGTGLVIALLANRWGTDRRLSEAVIAAIYGALEDRAGA